MAAARIAVRINIKFNCQLSSAGAFWTCRYSQREYVAGSRSLFAKALSQNELAAGELRPGERSPGSLGDRLKFPRYISPRSAPK